MLIESPVETKIQRVLDRLDSGENVDYASATAFVLWVYLPMNLAMVTAADRIHCVLRWLFNKYGKFDSAEL